MKKIILVSLMLISIMLGAGCSVQKSQNQLVSTIKNENYSYEKEEALDFDTFSMYDKEYLAELKTKYKLEEKISSCKTDFDKVITITKWVSNLWQHDGINEPEKGDPISILDEVTQNGQQFRCVEYGVVIAGCLNALDIPARTIGLKTSDVETRDMGAGHVATEVYLKDLQKWIFVDGQFGVIPTYNGTPLNAVEFSEAINKFQANDNNGKLELIKMLDYVEDDKYFAFVKEYLYYFDVSYFKNDENGKKIAKSVMLVPIGAKNPTKFQIKYEINMDRYTNSVVDFYPNLLVY